MNKVWVMPYNMGSASAKALAEAIGSKRVNKESTALIGNQNKKLINWGNTRLNHPELLKCTILNTPSAVKDTCNKLTFFQKIKESNPITKVIPEFTTSKEEAVEWIAENNSLVVARLDLTGHSGNGIVLMSRDNPEQWVEAPLYTRYIPKKDEYRVHFMNGEIFFYQRKAAVREHQNHNWKVRNLAGGFIYANIDVEAPRKVTEAVLEILGYHPTRDLFFGAVDVVYNEREDKAVVLEINTAPGLAGTTLVRYKEAFEKHLVN